MRKIVTFFVLFLSFMGVFGFSFKIFNKKFDDSEKPNEINFSSLTYAALGDSITYGADYSRGYAQMDTPYCEEVKSILGLRSVKNYGISGTCLSDIRGTSDTMARRYVNMADSFDIVSVLGGINDFNSVAPLGNINSNDYSSIYGSYNILVNGLKRKYPKAFIFLMTPLKETSSWSESNNSYSLPDVVKAVKDIGNKYNLPVLDLYSDCPYELEMYKDYSDGLHPSQEFVIEHLAPVIADFIKTNYKAA